MTKIRFFLLALALTLTPVLLAVELAEEFPAGWSCRPAVDWPLQTCLAVCVHYDGSNVVADGEPRWICPGSNVRQQCSGELCTSEEECRLKGLDFTPCHDRERWVCQAKARRENRVTCPVKGPPGSAIKLGDCVLRIVKQIAADPPVLQLRHACWNPPHDNYAPKNWRPAHPEALKAWFYSDSP